jgi:hypothetical protein
MKLKYNLKVFYPSSNERSFNKSYITSVEADSVEVMGGSYLFKEWKVKDVCNAYNPIAYYPVQYTIIESVETL